jgi:hypothetical protein
VAERSGIIDDAHYTTPIYHKAEAAHIIAVPAQTLRNWSVGYAYKRLDGSQVVSARMATTLEPAQPRAPVVRASGRAWGPSLTVAAVAAYAPAGRASRPGRAPTGRRVAA